MANDWMEKIHNQLASRSARERKILAAGGVLLLLLIAYGGVYEPLHDARMKLEERLPAQRAELRLMRAQVTEIERLRRHMGAAAKGTLEQRIKASAASFGLGEAFSQFTPLTKDQIQVVTLPLPTNRWTEWLADLGRQGVVVARCRINAGDESGLASLELTLTGGQQ